MLNKIKTPVINIAYVANAGLPKPVQAAVEEDFRLLHALYVSCVMRGKREEFMHHIAEFCARETIEIADLLRAKFGNAETAAVAPCEDWKKGFRTPHGGCTNCGGKH